jgi:hypothetical protein
MTPAQKLARRDFAAAALTGAIGADFGADYGDDYGNDADLNGDFGYQFGATTAAPMLAPKPTPQAMAQLWHSHLQQRSNTHARVMRLNPNMNSTVKIERYNFNVNVNNAATGVSPIVSAACSLQGQNTPDVHFRPERVSLNVTQVALVLLTSLKVGNVDGIVGGQLDGATLGPNAVNTAMSLPTLTPSTKANVAGTWTSFVPAGFIAGASYPLSLQLIGPASLAPSL